MSSASDPFLATEEKTWDSISDDHLSYHVEEHTRTSLSSIRRYRTLRACTILLALWGIIASIMLVLPRHSRPDTLAPQANECDCGTTLEAALAKGCKYDSLASAWLPASCRDDKLTAEFEKSGPNGSWSYWADQEGKQEMSLDEVAALGPAGGIFWTTREWHIAHCMFYWRKMYRMKYTGTIMERRFDGERHIQHCGKLVMKAKPKEFFLLNVPVQMNSAISLDPNNLPGMHHVLSEG